MAKKHLLVSEHSQHKRIRQLFSHPHLLYISFKYGVIHLTMSRLRQIKENSDKILPL